MALTITYATNTTKAQFGISGPDAFAEDVLGLSTGGFVASSSNINDFSGSFPFVPTLNFYDANMNLVATREPAAGATDGRGTRLTQLTNTNVVVVWDEDDASNPGLKAAIYDSTGNLVRGEFAVSTASLAHNGASVTALNGGGFVVEGGQNSNGPITFRTYDSAGNLVGLADNTVDAAAGDSNPEVVALASGGFVASWFNSGTHTVRARLYDSAGTAQSAAFDIGANSSSFQPSGVAAYAFGFAVAYRDTQWSGDGISLKIFDSAGANTTPGGVIRVDQTNGVSEGSPDVTLMQDGNILVTWTRGDDVYGRVFDALAQPLMNEFMLSDAGSSDSGAAATLLNDGRIVLNWTTNGDPVGDPYGNVDVGKVLQLERTVTGDAAADSYHPTDFERDIVNGGNGADSLGGGYGADTINGQGGNDVLEGGNDSDLLSGGLGRDKIYGASKASPDGLYPAADSLNGDAGDDALYGGSGGDSMSGGDDEDLLSGRGGADRMAGDLGEDTLFGGDGDDTLQGGLDGDRLAGGAGNDVIFGMTQADPAGSTVGDTATGGAGNDLIRGSAGGDDLAGNGGRDTLTGGAGTDTLEGGAQADRFVYLAASESTYDTGPDRITDLNDIDRIDLSAIDANPFEAGDQKFKLVSDLTSHPGEVRVTFLTVGPYAGSTAIIGDVNGDGTPDFFIVADGNHAGYDNFIY